MARNHPRLIVGWREWVSFPALGGAKIKAKVDTGARSSALHASNRRLTEENGERIVSFEILQKRDGAKMLLTCKAPLRDIRNVRSSNGQIEKRFFIVTPIEIGGVVWPVELSLTNRDAMGFPALIGRQALARHVLIDPNASFVQGDATETGVRP